MSGKVKIRNNLSSSSALPFHLAFPNVIPGQWYVYLYNELKASRNFYPWSFNLPFLFSVEPSTRSSFASGWCSISSSVDVLSLSSSFTFLWETSLQEHVSYHIPEVSGNKCQYTRIKKQKSLLIKHQCRSSTLSFQVNTALRYKHNARATDNLWLN